MPRPRGRQAPGAPAGASVGIGESRYHPVGGWWELSLGYERYVLDLHRRALPKFSILHKSSILRKVEEYDICELVFTPKKDGDPSGAEACRVDAAANAKVGE